MREKGADGILIRAASWALAALVLLPVLVVVWRSGGEVGQAWEDVVESRLWGHLRQTLLLLVSVVSLALLFGVPTAWVVSVYDFPGRCWMRWMLMLPMAMPGFVAAGAYVDVLEGLIPFYVWVRMNWGIDAFLKVQELAPWAFAVGVLGTTLFPYVFLSCLAVFRSRRRGPWRRRACWGRAV